MITGETKIKMASEYYYKGEYLIALYDREDFIVAVADNITDLLKLYSIPVNAQTLNQMTSKIGHALKRKDKRIYMNKQWLSIHLIPVHEDCNVSDK